MLLYCIYCLIQAWNLSQGTQGTPWIGCQSITGHTYALRHYSHVQTISPLDYRSTQREPTPQLYVARSGWNDRGK